MIIKLVINIIIITLLVLFFGLNFDTKIDIHFWFNNQATLKDVSLFVALIIAYLIGVITTVPLYIISNLKKKKKSREEEPEVLE